MDTDDDPATASSAPTAGAPPQRPGKVSTDDLTALVELTHRATVAYGRPDLTEIIDRAAARHADRDLSVLVVGEFKQGKSTLVNALVNAPLSAAADDVATVVPTIVRYGPEPSAHVVYKPAGGEGAPAGGTERGERREPVGFDAAIKLGSEEGNPGNREGVRSIELAIPRRLLQSGLSLVDTPGVGGLDSAHGAATLSALALAEIVLFVSDASQPLTSSELDFLRTAVGRCPNVVLVMPKTDIQPAWRRVEELNRSCLDEAGLDIDVIPVSSVLRQRAAAEGSTELNAESGFDRLVPLLRDAAGGDAARLASRTTLSDVLTVVDQLVAGFDHERAALEDPDSIATMVADLERARERAGRLRDQSAKWFQTLNDGVQDLTADLDHDLRLRVRRVLDEIDEALAENDPAAIWDEFEQWLHTRAAYEISGHHYELAVRSDALAQRVAEHFSEDEARLGVEVNTPAPTVDARRLAEDLDLRRLSATDKALAAMRGSYGGLLMFGMMGQMIGLALLNPLTVVIGVGLGRRALKEEKARRLAQRQQQAKAAARKYVDDVNLQASKVSRDTVRTVHRDLRDEFSRRADTLQTTIRESIQAAENSTKQAASARAGRLADVSAELERLRKLRRRAVSAMTSVGGTA